MFSCLSFCVAFAISCTRTCMWGFWMCIRHFFFGDWCACANILQCVLYLYQMNETVFVAIKWKKNVVVVCLHTVGKRKVYYRYWVWNKNEKEYVYVIWMIEIRRLPFATQHTAQRKPNEIKSLEWLRRERITKKKAADKTNEELYWPSLGGWTSGSIDIKFHFEFILFVPI